MPGITVFGHIAIVVGGVFLGLHYTLIQCTQPFWGDLLIGTLCGATALGYALIKAPRNFVTRFLVRVAFFWSGLAFLAGLAFAGQFVLAQAGFLVGDGMTWLAAVALGGVGFLRARHPIVRFRRVEGDYDTPFRLLHLTDLHIGDVWSKDDLARIVRKTRHYRPDCVVITGDLLDGMEPVDPDLVAPLAEFDAPVYFVSGNHDSYTEREALLDALVEVGVTPLEGKIQETDRLSLLGVGYATDEKKQEVLARALRETKHPRVVLKHKPGAIEPLLDAAPDAILCGHVHNGQVWPLGLFAYIEFPHVEGTHWYDCTMLHVSQGTATWGPPFRLGTRSEFTVVDFVPAEGGDAPLGREDEPEER